MKHLLDSQSVSEHYVSLELSLLDAGRLADTADLPEDPGNVDLYASE